MALRYRDRPDDELVTAAKSGDREAVDALLRRHYDRLYAVCRRICGHDADAADATQLALLGIVRGLDRFDQSSAFTTWAYRIATNAALDELRRRKRRPDPVGSGAEDDRDEVGGAAIALAGGGRDGRLETPMEDRVSASVDVDRALQRLPPDYRAAVVLRDLCGLEYGEIAEVLGIPGGTVRSRIARGRAALVILVAGNHPPSAQRHRPTDV